MTSWSFIKKRFSLRNWWYWVPIFLIVFIYVFFYSKIHTDINPDLIAYFSVAKHYQNLDFVQAFNSYWSPLICWIMALAPQLKESPMMVFRFVSLGVALLLFHQLFFWIRLVVYKSYSRFLLCVLLMLLITEFSLSMATPDFLSLACFFLFLKLLLRYRFKWKQSVLLALSILVCYFSKTFLLTLCISVIVFYILFLWFYLKRKIVSKQILLIMSIVVIGLFVWASCLKLHYGFYTLSSSAIFNNSIPSSEIVSLQTPPFEKSLFIWEDPSYIKVTPFYAGSLEFVIETLQQRFIRNFETTLYYFRFISYLWIGILIIPFLALFQKRTRQWKFCLLLLSVFLLNWFGYFLVLIMERYLIIGQFALYLSVFGFLEILLNRVPAKLKPYNISQFILFFVFISMLKNPIHEFRYGLKVYTDLHNEVTQSKLLANAGILKGKKIATFYDTRNLHDLLSLACFHGGGQYYGEVWVERPWQEQLKEIQKFKLDYIAVYDCYRITSDCDKKTWLDSYPVIYRDSVMNVKIYRLR